MAHYLVSFQNCLSLKSHSPVRILGESMHFFNFVLKEVAVPFWQSVARVFGTITQFLPLEAGNLTLEANPYNQVFSRKTDPYLLQKIVQFLTDDKDLNAIAQVCFKGRLIVAQNKMQRIDQQQVPDIVNDFDALEDRGFLLSPNGQFLITLYIDKELSRHPAQISKHYLPNGPFKQVELLQAKNEHEDVFYTALCLTHEGKLFINQIEYPQNNPSKNDKISSTNSPSLVNVKKLYAVRNSKAPYHDKLTHHFLMTTENGNLFCWETEMGPNKQLRLKNKPEKLPITGVDSIIYNAVNPEVIFITAASGLYSYGYSRYSTFGFRTKDLYVEKPLKLPLLSPVEWVLERDSNYFALAKERLYVWGRNANGELGLGHKSRIDEPEEHPFVQNIKKMTPGEHGCVVMTNDNIWLHYDYQSQTHTVLAENIKSLTIHNDISEFRCLAVTHKGQLLQAIIPDWKQDQLAYHTPITAVECDTSSNVVYCTQSKGLFIALTEKGDVYTWGKNTMLRWGQLAKSIGTSDELRQVHGLYNHARSQQERTSTLEISPYFKNICKIGIINFREPYAEGTMIYAVNNNGNLQILFNEIDQEISSDVEQNIQYSLCALPKKYKVFENCSTLHTSFMPFFRQATQAYHQEKNQGRNNQCATQVNKCNRVGKHH